MTTRADVPPDRLDDPHSPAPDGSGPAVISVRAPVLEVVIGALLFLMALYLWFAANDIDVTTPGLRGPAGFPRGIAAIFGAVSLAMAIRGAMQLRSGRDVKIVTFVQPSAVFINMVLIAIYPVLLAYLGYYLATGPWLIALLYASGYRKWLPMLLCTAGFLIFTKTVFQMLIGIPLP